VGSRLASFDAGDVQLSAIEIHAVPAQPRQLDRPQGMAESNVDHRLIAKRMAVVACRLDQALDLGLGQVFPASDIGIRPLAWGTARLDCAEFSDRRDEFETRFPHEFQAFV
jgi:hypothetical protein